MYSSVICFFSFLAKPGTTNNHGTGVKKFPTLFPVSRETGLNF